MSSWVCAFGSNLTQRSHLFSKLLNLLRVSKILPKVIHFSPRNSHMQEEAMAIIISPHENSRTFLPRVCSSCCSIFTALPSLSINLRLALCHFSVPDILSGKELLPIFPLMLTTSSLRLGKLPGIQCQAKVCGGCGSKFMSCSC